MSSFLYRPCSRSGTGPVTPPCCARPRIFHSDQGVQYTSDEMTAISLEVDIRISMCGRGRCYDNILNERLWRSVEYEEVYLNEYATLHEARARLQAYFACYNHQRPHQGCNIGRRTWCTQAGWEPTRQRSQHERKRYPHRDSLVPLLRVLQEARFS